MLLQLLLLLLLVELLLVVLHHLVVHLLHLLLRERGGRRRRRRGEEVAHRGLLRLRTQGRDAIAPKLVLWVEVEPFPAAAEEVGAVVRLRRDHGRRRRRR